MQHLIMQEFIGFVMTGAELEPCCTVI